MIVRTRALKLEEGRRYVSELKKADGTLLPYAAIAALAIGLGARIGEVLSLRNGDVLTDEGIVREKVRRKISKKRRTVMYRETAFCDPELRAIVQRFADSEDRKSRYFDGEKMFFSSRWSGSSLTYRSAWERNKIFLRGAGIETHGVAFHGLRKTFLTAVFRQINHDTGDMLKALTCVQRMAGHRSIDTTILYLDLSEVNEEAAIRTALSGMTEENCER